jgi:hypothetical protein
MRGTWAATTVLAFWLGLWAGTTQALADGGTLRFSGRRDDRLISVFTTPTPAQVGQIDLSVLVQQAESGRAITDLPIEVRAHRVAQPEQRVAAAATKAAATNKLMLAAPLELPQRGRWHVDVLLGGLASSPPISFELEVTEGPVPWLQLSLWIAWPIVPIGLFAARQLRLRGRPGIPAINSGSRKATPHRLQSSGS